MASLRVGYFGPEGTFTHEALIESTAGVPLEHVPYPTIYDTAMAVQSGAVERALVPIENSMEGSVNATLDTLAIETEDVAIVGEVVHPIRHCLIARTALELSRIETVVSHPQATAQCAKFIRTHLPRARVLAGASTAEAVRIVAEHEGPWAALGNRLAAERYGCTVLRTGLEDGAANETRFVWLAAVGSTSGAPEKPEKTAHSRDPSPPTRKWKTAIVFWGAGSEAAGWLVGCLAELADRQVNLTRIESRPLKRALGQYMFFADLDGRDSDQGVVDALQGLRTHVAVLRILGSFPVG
ncbi:MAG: prephenate dehydratase [Actinomycetota bacterium]|nr:prephenate dehydratase [Actinomycetota bacterium]